MGMKAFFDTIDHGLMMRAIEKHVTEKWILLYIRRWLESPVALAEGGLQERSCGTPQGGVDQSATGQSLPALRFRCLDAALLSCCAF
jgi:hypothetical protein